MTPKKLERVGIFGNPVFTSPTKPEHITCSTKQQNHGNRVRTGNVSYFSRRREDQSPAYRTYGVEKENTDLVVQCLVRQRQAREHRTQRRGVSSF